MIRIYSGSRGFGFLLFFALGLFLFLLVFFWGITAIMEMLLPLLIVVAYLMIVVFVLGFLPATLVKGLRPVLSMYALLMSYALGTATWALAFLFVIRAFGFWGILFTFFFKYLGVIAMVGALAKGAWHVAAHLALWSSFTYIFKFYSRWLLTLKPRDRRGNNSIIDVEARGI